MKFDTMGQYINISAATCHTAVEITILPMEYNVCKLQPKDSPESVIQRKQPIGRKNQ
jgi:hypothetical protein